MEALATRAIFLDTQWEEGPSSLVNLIDNARSISWKRGRDTLEVVVSGLDDLASALKPSQRGSCS